MKISAVLALISAVAAAALPTDGSANDLVTRAKGVSNLPNKSCRCGGSAADASTYTAGDIKKAADGSLNYVIQNKQIGKASFIIYLPGHTTGGRRRRKVMHY